jgi:hypothetical protein
MAAFAKDEVIAAAAEDAVGVAIVSAEVGAIVNFRASGSSITGCYQADNRGN